MATKKLEPEPPAAVDRGMRPAWCVLACGIAAAMHVGKLPPAIPALQQDLGVGVVQSAWLLSAIQCAAMVAGLGLALACTRIGLRRSFAAGLAILALASASGGLSRDAGDMLLARAVESVGLLLVVTSGPALLRSVAPAGRDGWLLAVWGTFMPAGVAIAMLLAPPVILRAGWSGWWLACAVPTALAGWAFHGLMPKRPGDAGIPRIDAVALGRDVVGSPGPGLVGLAFGLYSGTWLLVIGFLPAMLTDHGFSLAAAARVAAVATIGNVAGNLLAGLLLRRGWQPRYVLATGFASLVPLLVAMFADLGQPAAARIAAAIAFSAIGGVIPGTLFPLAARVAPAESAIAATTGWMVQLSALGQIAIPPLVASRVVAGGWPAATPVAILVMLAAIATGLALGPRHFRR